MILIFGIGNTLRRDDGAGWIFAEALADTLRHAGAPVHLELHQQLTPELAMVIAEAQPATVVFVDAGIAITSAAIESLLDEIAAASPATHSLSPAALLTMARRLYDVTARGWLVQTPAEDFDHGEGLSPLALRGLRDVESIASTLLS